MAFIPKDKITDIRTVADVVEIVSESVILKKAGKDYKGLCPFHTEKTPSFTVSPEKQIFHCFGCGTGGDVFNFLMEQEGLSFSEAARTLARRYGIEIPTHNMSPEDRQRMDERESLFAVNRQAADFFHHTLLNSPAGEKAMAYLEARGITKETIDAFHLGYDSYGGDNFTNYCSHKGISRQLAEKVGLIGSKDGRFYDRFWNRIVFPIFDVGMRVIGFGGRVTDNSNPKRPKYYNSPETPLYNKSRSLYGLHRAKQKCRQTGIAYLVEGYVDVLSLYQHGIENAVATLGTAITPEHVRLLKGYVREVILVYDSDEAGVRAAQRSIGIFRKENMDVRILVLPSGYDPDAFLFEFGPGSFTDAAENAFSAMSFLTNAAIKKHGLSVEGKIRILSEMKGALASVHDSVARSLYIREFADRIHIDESAVLEQVREVIFENKKKKQTPQQYLPNPVPGAAASSPAREKGSRIEQQIIAMMLQFPGIIAEIHHRNLIEVFENDTLKSVCQTILKHSDGSVGVPELIGLMDDKEKRDIATSLAMKEDVWTREGCLKLIAQFESIGNRRKNTFWVQKIGAAEETDDYEKVVLAGKEFQREKQIQAGKRQ